MLQIPLTITGELIKSEIINGRQESIWRVPALSESIARRKAVLNMRIKGNEGIEVQSANKVGSGNLPRQDLFDVVVTAER